MEPKTLIELRRDFAEFLQEHDVPVPIAVKMMLMIESLTVPDTMEELEEIAKAA